MTVKRSFKTKKKVTGNVQRYFHPWTRNNGSEQVWEEGDYVIGEYLMSITDKFKNDCPIIKVLETNFSSPVLDREGEAIDELEGKNIQLNHNGSLAYAFFGENDNGKDSIPLGEIVQITYTGQIILETGPFAGKPSHQVEVDILEEEEDTDEF